MANQSPNPHGQAGSQALLADEVASLREYVLSDYSLSYASDRKGEAAKCILHIEHLSIRPGDHIALLGKSGAGKTSLLQHLRRLMAGQASWCPQQPSLVPQLKVFHNIYCGALARHSAFTNLKNLLLPVARFKTQIHSLATPLGIDDLLWSKAQDLSGGQQQRVAIARCLYQQKPYLLADEPVSALDKTQGQAILAQLIGRHHSSVVALHDAQLALALCNRVIGLKDQAIVIDCPVAELTPDILQQLYQ